jgi:hypothetical protein
LAVVLPSSQTSAPLTTPLPHTTVETQVLRAPAAPVQLKLASVRHCAEQPSPVVVLPSSHCSVPSRRASPQTTVRVHSEPGVLQV